MKGEPIGLDFRYTYVTDLPYLRQWLSDPEVEKWLPCSHEKEREDAAQCWVGFSRYSSSLTAVIGGEPVGMATLFLMPYKKVSHHCLFKIVVSPAYQRQGIGRALLKNIKHLAKSYFRLDLIHTEVFAENPLISLLEEQGFEEYGRQENFVRQGDTYRARVLYECFL